MNGWDDAVKTMRNTGEKEVEFALYKNGEYQKIFITCYVINGKAADYTAIISFVFDKEENEIFLIIKDLAQEKKSSLVLYDLSK